MVTNAHYKFELALWDNGIQYVAGIDEVGRGPWAGPVIAASVIFPKHSNLIYRLRDSKKLSSQQREKLYPLIFHDALSVGIGIVSAKEIDNLGITASTFKAMRLAIDALSIKPEHFLIDAFHVPGISEETQTPIIKGDAQSISIAAASVVAKVHRDNVMITLSQEERYKHYGFDKHKGYGTKLHKEAILKYGLSHQHRKTFIHFNQ